MYIGARIFIASRYQENVMLHEVAVRDRTDREAGSVDRAETHFVIRYSP